MIWADEKLALLLKVGIELRAGWVVEFAASLLKALDGISAGYSARKAFVLARNAFVTAGNPLRTKSSCP